MNEVVLSKKEHWPSYTGAFFFIMIMVQVSQSLKDSEKYLGKLPT